MKSTVSMLFVLATALLLSNSVRAGYANGMNQYAAYHVMHGAVDPMGTNTVEITPGRNGNIAADPATGRFTNVLSWSFDVPQSTLACEEGEVLVYEYKISWQIIGQYSYTPNRSGDYSGVGDYHVTFEDWLGEMGGPHSVHVGSGTGRSEGEEYYQREFLNQYYPNFGDLQGQDRVRAIREARQYAAEQIDLADDQRNIANTSGDFSYEVTAHCVCEDIEWQEPFTKNGEDIGAFTYRNNTEFADMTSGPTRFRTANDFDLRTNSRWVLGSPPGEPSKSENVASGGFRFYFGDTPNNESISTY